MPDKPEASAPSAHNDTSAAGDTPVPPSGFEAGATIADKYVVERVVGEGGLGVVVAARHIHLGHTVAIKYLRPRALENKRVAERFLREGRMAARIRSEHVVRVYDVGTLPDGAPYMVMEFLEGTDLGQLLSLSGPLTIEEALEYIVQVCEALAEAHVAGIVHRDLKPDNLFFTTGSAGKPVVKVLDFGISKASAVARTAAERLPQLTPAEEQFGTPVYMSPEQLRSSSDVDARADVWAIGVVLYELLTGRMPFNGESLPELCTAILTAPPVPLRKVRPSMPVGLQAIIERCLQKEADHRYQNVAELSQDLSPFAPSSTHPRIEHVIRVIRSAGQNVRLSAPAAEEIDPPAQRNVATVSVHEERPGLTTDNGAASWGGSAAQAKSALWTRARVAAAAGALVASCVFVALVRDKNASPSPPSNAAASQHEVSGNAAETGSESHRGVPTPSAILAATVVVEPSALPSANKPGPSAASPLASPGTTHEPVGSGYSIYEGKYLRRSADPNAVINPFE